MRCAILAVLVSLSAVPLTSAANPTPLEKEWQVDGVARRGLVCLPASASKNPAPVVFAFHGHGGTAAHAARTFAFQTHWPEAIVVYMQGLNTPGRLTDPEGKKSGWQSEPGDQKDRDLRFFDVVLTSLKADYKIDDKRIYATGHSNGGGFTFLLMAQRNDVFAAVAPSAAIPGKWLKELKPRPILHVAGEKDPLVKYSWQTATMDAVKKLNGCAAEGKSWNKSGALVGTLYPSRTGNPLVTLIHPGDHKYPEEASVLITKFFQEHKRD